MSWHGKGQRVTAGPYVLNDPLIYASPRLGRYDEASCVDLSLPIGTPVAEPPGRLGYYPAYTAISRHQRANYLEWLAGNRTGPLDDIGYAFIFFYGLERRLLLERQDLSPIVKEVVRLLETYTFSGSFDGYLSRFLSYTLARVGIATLKDKWFEAVFERTRAQRDEQHLAVGLAWLLSRELPLPVHWAMRIARLDPRASRSVVLDRFPDQFNELFTKRYRERFGDGMRLAAAKREREVVYRPASPSLLDLARASEELKPVHLPNVMGIQSQFQPLVDIWTTCIEDLKPVSRVLARWESAPTREAFEALPNELKAGVEHPDKPEWDRVATEHVRDDGVVLVAVERLAAIHGIPSRPKLTAKQSESLARTAHHVGFVIEPDVRVTNRPYGWDDVVALLRPEESPELPKDSRYAGAALMLELGLYVASADGNVEDEEVDHIARFLESQFLLDPPDARRLEALKQVLVQRKPSLTGVGKRFQAILDLEQRTAVGRFLVGVAAANGTIDRNEITALRSAYKTLGVDAALLNQLLDEFRGVTREPVTVSWPPSPTFPGEPIPPRPGSEEGVRLDEGLLRRILSETQEVARILGEAMREVESNDGESPDETTLDVPPEDAQLPPEEAAPGTESASVGVHEPVAGCLDSRFDGLDRRFHAVLAELLTSEVWPRSEFDALIRRHNLMPSGTLDRINEWSQERFDDLLIADDEDALTVHANLIGEGP